MNKRNGTIAKLIDAGLKQEGLLVLKEPVSSLAALKGLIGCLCGIYTDDIIPDIKENALPGGEHRGTASGLEIIDQSI